MIDDQSMLDKNNYTDRDYVTNLASTGFDFLKTIQEKIWLQPTSALSSIIEKSDNLDLDAVRFILDTNGRSEDPQAMPVLLKSALERSYIQPYAENNGTLDKLLDILLQKWEGSEKSEWVNKFPRQLAAYAVIHAMAPESVYDVFRVLEKHDLDLNHRDLYDHTLLHLFSFNPMITEYLMDRGFDPNHREGRYGHTPLCTLCGYVNLLELYTTDPASIYEMYGNIMRSAETLLQHGAEVNLTAREPIAAYNLGVMEDTNLVTLLHMAAKTTLSQPRTLVELLLEHGAAPNARNAKDQTMLHTACITCITGIKSQNDPEQMIRSYVSSGGDINAKDYEHNTALHLIAEMYNKTPTECVENIYKLLLKYGADPELTNCKNRRPWEMCSMKKQKRLKKIEKEASYAAWSMDMLSDGIDEFVR